MKFAASVVINLQSEYHDTTTHLLTMKKFVLISLLLSITIQCGCGAKFKNNLYGTHKNMDYFDADSCGRESYIPFAWNSLVIQTNVETKNVTYCSASLITDMLLLTSARCVMPKKSTVLSIKVSHLEPYEGTNTYSAHSFKVILHPKFNNQTMENNIAVVQLKYPATLHNRYPICLPFYGEQKNRRINNYTITGWGETKTQAANVMLFYGFIQPYSHEACRNLYRGVIDITDKHICVYNNVTGTAPCSGDGGSPLQVDESGDKFEQYYIYGILSYTKEPCGSGPAVYTKVSEYMDFIFKNAANRDVMIKSFGK